MRIRQSLLALLMTSVLTHAALAQDDVLVYRSGARVDAQEVARVLGGNDADASMRMRSIRMLDAPPKAEAAPPEAARPRPVAHAPAPRPGPAVAASTAPAPIAVVSQRPVSDFARTGDDLVVGDKAAPTSLALPVQFAFDSADILPQARAQLDALAYGIKLLSPERHVVIEGHTDAAGSDDYNLQLSQRRAQSVLRYLVAVHGIAEVRLQAVGYGEYRPLKGRDPFAVVNRRVQFRGA